MEHIERITSIETQAKALNLTLGSLCKKAGVPVSTIVRWKLGTTRSPTIYAYQKLIGKLEAQLSSERTRLGDEIAKSRPAPAQGVAA